MFFDEHAPPHFHAEYGEFKASIDFRSLEITGGKLPRRAQELVLDWAELHRNELMDNWELCRQHLEPKKSNPCNRQEAAMHWDVVSAKVIDHLEFAVTFADGVSGRVKMLP